jgi:hypothetical protein
VRGVKLPYFDDPQAVRIIVLAEPHLRDCKALGSEEGELILSGLYYGQRKAVGCLHIKLENAVCTSQETHCVSATEPNRLMLFGETVAVY